MHTNVALAAGAPPFVARFTTDQVVRVESISPVGPSGDVHEFVMSDNSVDRMGDVIEPSGWVLDNFADDKNPIALFGHKSDNVVGQWSNVRVVGNKLLGRLNLARSGTSALVDTVRALVEQKILRAVSVGFRPIKYELLNNDADEWFGPFRFIEQELLECSLVAVPANANALSTAKSLHLPRDVMAEIFRKPAIEDRSVTRALTRKPANALVPIGAKKMLTRAQRIEAAQTSINTMRDRLDCLDGMESRNESEAVEYAELPAKITATAESLEQMEAAERALTGKSGKPLVPAGASAIRLPAAPRGKIENPRELMVKTVTALFIAKGSNKTLEDVLRDRYSGESYAADVIRTVTNPAMTTVAGWAAELVGQAIADFLDLLPRSAIYPVMKRQGASFTFGANGKIIVPSRTTTSKINGSFVGEGQAIPVRMASLTSVTLLPKKMAVISTFTREMANSSTPSIEGVIRQAMNEDTAEAIDTILIDNVVADAIRPAGLLAGLSTLTPAATGTQFEKMVADINTLAGPITAARGGGSLVMIMNPAQKRKMSWAVAPNGTFVFASVDGGVVRDLTAVASTTVPAARVIMVDANEFATATGDSPEFDVSDVATIHEETVPLPLSATGSPNVVAAPVRSLWQTASLGVRMILPMNWTMRRASMVTFMDGVTW